MHISRQARIRRNLELRARVIQSIRFFFTQEGYLEVETPVRIPAPAPEAHIDAQESGEWFLHTSPELCMKRLAASGFEKIFQICKCFRKKERGDYHLPEMTMLEWYCANATYLDIMRECEMLIGDVVRCVQSDNCIRIGNQEVDLAPPWKRLSVSEAFRQYGSLSPEQALAENRFDEIIGLEVQPHLGWNKPVFLYDFPSACAALARRKPQAPELAERFELFIGGVELCNCFTELTDPEEQRLRFEAERNHQRRMNKTTYPLPEPFLRSLPHMPPTAGNALGVDRLVMLLANTKRIDDIIAFTPEEL